MCLIDDARNKKTEGSKTPNKIYSNQGAEESTLLKFGLKIMKLSKKAKT
jgi:hypothetical protein